MTDYSQYSYKNLLAFLHNDSRYDSDGVDYAEYLLSMPDADSIPDMMAIYDKVFEKTAYYIFARTYPTYWFITDSWKSKQHFYFELNQCLNENILRWYKSLENPTREQCVACLVNLRQSERVTKIQNEIASYNSNIQLSGQFFADKRNELCSTILKVRKHAPGTEQYRIAVEEYATLLHELSPMGYEKSIEEKKFEELRKINIQKEIERREARKKREEEVEAQRKRKGRKRIIYLIIVAIFVNIICALILLYGLDIGMTEFFLMQCVFCVGGLLFLAVGFLYDYYEKRGHELSSKSKEGRQMFYAGGCFFLFCPNLFLLGISVFDGIGGFFGLILVIGLIGSIPKVLLTGKF